MSTSITSTDSIAEGRKTDLYNFLAAWQLFPEKGTYEFGTRPKSGNYRIGFSNSQKEVNVSMSWVTLEDHAFASDFVVIPDGEPHPISTPDIADTATGHVLDSTHFTIEFSRGNNRSLQILHEITPQGFLKVTQVHTQGNDQVLTNTEFYHKQLSVLPYSASVSGAVIRPTEEGMIRHHALTSMEEQTNMQLTQIRQQIELLAIQAREIQKRKELSIIIYDAKLSFSPVVGQTYYLYMKEDGSHLVSMVSPKEWGAKIPFKAFVAAVKLLADHTWQEM